MEFSTTLDGFPEGFKQQSGQSQPPISIGFCREDQPELLCSGEATDAILPGGYAESTQAPFIIEHNRTRVTPLSSRIVRDRLFCRLILQAYDKRCATTGLNLINGGGRAEVDAAHIRPVEANGPDILLNSTALSGTPRWVLDRGLIGLSDDLKFLVPVMQTIATASWI